MKSEWTIYGLKDPRDNEIKYVGKAWNIKERYRQHLSDTGNSRKCKWIAELFDHKLFPVLVTLETGFDSSKSSEAEKKWITSLKRNGINLVNGNSGGCSIVEKKDETVVFSLRWPKWLFKAVNAECKRQERSLNWMIKKQMSNAVGHPEKIGDKPDERDDV